MGDYNRASRECTFGQLRPEIVSAIREYVLKHELGSLEAEIIACVETASEKKKKGLFAGFLGSDPDPVHHTGVLLTPAWLIWARSGAKYGVAVSSARLSEIEITDLASRFKDLGPKAIDDEGLTVFGFVNGSPERVSAFIGLGSETAAYKFRQTVKSSVAQAKRR